LVWKVTEPEVLLPEAYRYASLLAAKPISSLVHTKAAIVAPFRAQLDAARARESASFAELMGGPANSEALAAFAEKRPADFTRLPPGA
jgi:enoyl-CoA hydratase/carnithine racemase